MTKARKTIVSLQDTPYYHCIGRCVRRAFLCGIDSYSGKNYEHRRQWVIDRLQDLTQSYAIQVAAYAVMSNHYHLVLHVDNKTAKSWSDDEVMRRWQRIYPGDRLLRKYRKGLPLDSAEQLKLANDVLVWRERLMDLSWFMKGLNEFLARKANAEDQCKGRFWESRFKSQGLLDDWAILSCMAYVDLNPIRAVMAEGLEDSEYTSVQQRLQELQYAHQRLNATQQENKADMEDVASAAEQSLPLLPFIESEHRDRTFAAIPFNLKQYIELVDWTGHQQREDKRGAISSHTPPILNQLGLTDAQWLELSTQLRGLQRHAIHGGDILWQLHRRRSRAA